MQSRFRFYQSRYLIIVLLTVFWVIAAQPQTRGTQPVQIHVDASEATRRIFHARLVIPVSPGPLTLVYPKWIPGEHGPTGPVTDLAGLRMGAHGKAVLWRRDETDMYAFHCEVPADASVLEVSFDFLSPPPNVGGFSSGASASAQLAVISWNQLLLYPKGASPRDLEYRASLKLPQDWKLGTALPILSRGQQIEFASVSLETLIDSPVLCGAHFREVAIGPAGDPPHLIEIAGDDEASLELSPEWKASFDRLVAETGLLFGARHYKSYRFLVSLSDYIAHFGLEHHESSDDRVPARTLIDENLRKLEADLFPHEFVHSWNGKYKRPSGLITADYQEPMRTRLLWVYEGLTQYLGLVLTTRSGFWTQEQYRENLARIAEWAQNQRGRAWGSLEDTTVAAQLRFNARPDWAAWRRGVDFYDEGVLIWLDVDTLIREQSRGQKSLDDFCRLFYGNQSGPPSVNPYTFDDLVASLNSIMPYDWNSFLTERVASISPRAPLGGMERAGWRLAYTDTPSELQKAREGERSGVNLTASIGLSLRKDGSVIDVVPGKAADLAGIAPGMKLVSVNSQNWSPEILRRAIAATKKEDAPLELSMENDGFFRTYPLNYHEGEKYPRLARDPSKVDLLAEILRSLRPIG